MVKNVYQYQLYEFYESYARSRGEERTPRPRETPVITQEDIVMAYMMD